jgi:hypothetical protein
LRIGSFPAAKVQRQSYEEKAAENCPSSHWDRGQRNHKINRLVYLSLRLCAFASSRETKNTQICKRTVDFFAQRRKGAKSALMATETVYPKPEHCANAGKFTPECSFYARPDAAYLSDIQNVKAPLCVSQIKSNISSELWNVDENAASIPSSP